MIPLGTLGSSVTYGDDRGRGRRDIRR